MLGIQIDLPKLNTGPFAFGTARQLGRRTGWFATEARPSQRPPTGEWRLWLLLAGRGYGKTRVLVEWAKDQARKMPGSRGAIVAATAADARDVLAEGPAGFIATSPPDDVPRYEPSKRRITWANGSQATLYSADEPNRLRGPQHHWAICDEFAAWNYPQDSFDMLMFGLRLGQDPRVVIATTPRPTKEVKALLQQPGLVVTRGTTYENLDNLAPAFREQIIARYEGTRLGRQELNAELLEDILGALWTQALLEDNRVSAAPELARIVVAVDPAVTANVQTSNETAIIVAGIAADEQGYVLEDLSGIYTPGEWAKTVIGAYDKWHADAVVGEVNNGGDLVKANVTSTAEIMYLKQTRISKEINFKAVRASRGKYVRAEPISSLDEQHRIHHVGLFAALEDQLATWVPGDDSPDRLDARVWAFTELMLGGGGAGIEELEQAFGWQG